MNCFAFVSSRLSNALSMIVKVCLRVFIALKMVFHDSQSLLFSVYATLVVYCFLNDFHRRSIVFCCFLSVVFLTNFLSFVFVCNVFLLHFNGFHSVV